MKEESIKLFIGNKTKIGCVFKIVWPYYNIVSSLFENIKYIYIIVCVFAKVQFDFGFCKFGVNLLTNLLPHW